VRALRRFLNVVRSSSLEREFDDEIRFHLEERARRLAAYGDADEAARAARRRFGSIERAKRGMRAARRPSLASACVSMSLAAVLLAMTMYWRSAARVYELGPGVTPPVPVASVKPLYTMPARQAKIQGTVRVRCVVGRDGICTDVAVVQSIDRRLGLDDAAVQALHAWRFRPALVNGTPVAARVLIEFTFALR
jgi:TonB family protein